MKRQITLSTALALSVLASLVSLPATALGQQRQRFAADSGVLTPGAGQILRVTVVGTGGNDAIRVSFRRVRYMAEGCNSDGACRHTVAAQDVTAPQTLNPNEAASTDIPGDGSGVRVVVLSNSRNARVVFKFIDAATGKTTSVLRDGVCTEVEE